MSRILVAIHTINWSTYNQALINRGNISIWFEPTTEWYAQPKEKSGQNQDYSDVAIQFCLMIKFLGAYATEQCRQVIADRQAYKVIPPRKMRSHEKIKRLAR